MSKFAQRLRLLRESRQLTQVRLAELIEVDARAYNRWERGTIAPQLDTLIRIADVLQGPLDELVERKPVSVEVRIRNHSLNALWQQADTLPDPAAAGADPCDRQFCEAGHRGEGRGHAR